METSESVPPLRIAALVKQTPVFESMELGPDGRLVREGLALEMSAYCRRAVAEAVHLVAEHGGSVTVITLGPPTAEDVLREAVAYGTDRDVAIDGVHICDPAFAGSDTLATARALAAALEVVGPGAAAFDLVLVGRNSVDADTGQVGPELAQLLDRPFATGVKQLALRPGADGSDVVADVGCELDDLWEQATVDLPAVLSTAERLIDPCKIKDRSVWAAVDAGLLRRLGPADLGPGPWGQAGSPTWVGEVRTEVVQRAGLVLDGTVADQVARAIEVLDERGVLVPGTLHGESDESVPATGSVGSVGSEVVVVVEPHRRALARELTGAAARLATDLGGHVTAVVIRDPRRAAGADGPDDADGGVDPATLSSWGADAVVVLASAGTADLEEEDVAHALVAWMGSRPEPPWAVLVGSTPWGREVASRVAAAIGAGLTGDAVGLATADGRLLAWKPAFGGSLVAAIHADSPVQLVTVRAGVLSRLQPRPAGSPATSELVVTPRGRVTVTSRRREDDLDGLARAEMVVGVGQGVDPARYGELAGLVELLGAELAATRKVTDNEWMPRARQLGITGRSISPRLYVAIGTSGKYNHTVGVRSAGTILAINPDPTVPLFGFADIGIVAAWEDAVPELERQLRAHLG